MAQSAVIADTSAKRGQTDFGDIQGIVRFGYGKLTAACFYLLRIADLAAAREWLATAPVTSAETRDPSPDCALQVALSAEGLRALGITEDVIAGFTDEYIAGMAADEARSRRLGDVGENAPENWRWGWGNSMPHVLVMAYATPQKFGAWKSAYTGPTWGRGFSVLDSLDTHDLGGREPFGFADGISQPAVDWNRTVRPANLELEYRNLTALGEFVLGYPNEYGIYTDRPLLDPSADPEALLPTAEDAREKRDLGRNGTYLVFRDLRQDVRGFWRFLSKAAQANNRAPRALAEAMVGRTLNGDPLVPLSDRPISGVDGGDRLNCFTYETDGDAARCPFGAHIRRANPRTADMPAGSTGIFTRLVHVLGLGDRAPNDDLVASARFHRILRRGRAYGTPLSPEDALRTDLPDDERGIRFICLNANISRQFEFVQNAWLASTKFDGLTEESDPLVGSRAPIAGCRMSNAFSHSREGGIRHRLVDVPQFVTLRGGGYFFLPGLKALRYLTRVSVGPNG